MTIQADRPFDRYAYMKQLRQEQVYLGTPADRTMEISETYHLEKLDVLDEHLNKLAPLQKIEEGELLRLNAMIKARRETLLLLEKSAALEPDTQHEQLPKS